ILLNAWAEQTPLLGKGGVDAPSRKIPVPLKGADGVVRSNSKTIFFEPTTPSAPDSVASQHLFDGAATPPFAKELLGFNPPFGNDEMRMLHARFSPRLLPYFQFTTSAFSPSPPSCPSAPRESRS